jgi:cellulose synthase operon protein YhjU
MGLWSYYFFLKFFLFAGKFIGFHFWPNLAFAIFVALPVRHVVLRLSKQVIAIPAGIALLYYDSWLPPFSRALQQAGEIERFSAQYLVELAGRFINPKVVAVLALMLVLHLLLSRKLRMSTFAFIAILIMPWWFSLTSLSLRVAPAPQASSAAVDKGSTPMEIGGPANDARLDQALSDFYSKESTRKVDFPSTAGSQAPFDIIFIHICSLAWDDLAYIDQRDNPLIRRFDVLFNNFDSAASYSGPAAIRLLRAPCGQEPHADLYKPAPPGCTLFDDLQNAGFTANWAMNHDGHFGGFISDVRDRGGMPATFTEDKGADISLRAFDGTPIYDDYSILSRWFEHRKTEAAPEVALYYNTITLHDGNTKPGVNLGNPHDSYATRFKKFASDIGRFMDLLQSSGRRAVVVFVPEHGANVRGDRMQISGLREIPSPAVALIPVGIKLIGFPPGTGLQGQKQINAPSSFLALSQLLANFMARDPFTMATPDLGDYVHDLPQTDFVAENEATVVMRWGSGYKLRNPDKTWSDYITGP